MEEGDASTGEARWAGHAGMSSIACAAAGVLPMAGPALLLSAAEQECSMTALGGYLAAFLCAGVGWIVALVGLPLGIRPCCHDQVRVGTVGIILNVLLLVTPVATILVIDS
jgi:hypothetical protein